MPSHGALSKSGKVRQKSRIQWREGKKSRTGRPFHGKKGKSPRVMNRKKYYKRIILKHKQEEDTIFMF